MSIVCPHCQSSALEAAPHCAVCGGPLIAAGALLLNEALPAGTSLQGGHFVLTHTLGQGGFGITYAGHDTQLKRRVAIKELFPTGCGRRDFTVMPTQQMGLDDFGQVKARFLEESRVLARFSHPGIVQVYGSFEENNTAYMAMEYLEGEPLSKRLSERGCLPEAEAIALIEKIGAALTVIHGVNLIHRDIKPENIMLVRDGRAVLIDFGSARGFAAGHSRHMTSVFTPGYAPLEQYSKQARFGTYTDIYALGATLYHCLTGIVPPDATDRASGVELKPPASINANISQSASDAVLWAMQMKIENRPAQVGEFLDVLTRRSFAEVARNVAEGQPIYRGLDVAKFGLEATWVKHINDTEFQTDASARAAYDALVWAYEEVGVSDIVCNADNLQILGAANGLNRDVAPLLQGTVTGSKDGSRVIVLCRRFNLTSEQGFVSRESKAVLKMAADYLQAKTDVAAIANSATSHRIASATFPPVLLPPEYGGTVRKTNGSGLGKGSSDVPASISGFNWGAFFLCPLWCLIHRSWLGYFCLTPGLGWFTPFLTGFLGNKEAWQNVEWESEEQFKQTQNRWAWWGAAVFTFGVIAWLMWSYR